MKTLIQIFEENNLIPERDIISEKINNLKKQTTMYQVHIKEGINAEVRNYDSLDRANRYVLEKASEMGLQYGIDQDGWAFAHTGDDYSPARTEIFIFQII